MPSKPPAEETILPTDAPALDLEPARPAFEAALRLARTAGGFACARLVFPNGESPWSIQAGDNPGAQPFSEDVLALDEPHWIADMAARPDVAVIAASGVLTATPVRSADGARLGVLYAVDPAPRAFDPAAAALLADIATLAAQAYEAVRARQALTALQAAVPRLLQTLVSAAPVAVAIYDCEMRYVDINEHWAFNLGVTREEVIGRSMYELDPQTEVWRGVFDGCLNGDIINVPRIPLQLLNGQTIIAATCSMAWPGPDGRPGGVISLLREVEPSGGTAYESQSAHKRLETAIRLADLNVWEMDYRTKATWTMGGEASFYEGARGFSGLANDSWIEVHPDDRERAREHYETCLREGLPYRTEYRIIRGDKTIWVQAASESTLNEKGEREVVLGVMRDITPRKLAEIAAAEARESAEAANRAKSEFLAKMSHEIRTPMNGVIGMNGLLMRTPLSPEQRKYAEAVRVSADALMGIIDDILDISKLEAGKVELEEIDFSMPALVEGAVELMSPKAHEKGLTLAAHIDGGARKALRGDPTRLRQVLLNLLSNALKFTEQGQVAVEVRSSPADAGKTRLRVEVQDTGIGLSDEAKGKLFQKFQQADGSITRKYGGTGLGLSISRQLVELMGGEIAVADRSGGGSVFWFEVELADGVEAVSTAGDKPRALSMAEVDADRAHVLLAEDNEINTLLARTILEQVGFRVDCVVNGREAVEAARAVAYDLILMDVQMPEMDGLEATRRIRSLGTPAAQTPIIAMTANAMQSDKDACLAAGMNDFVSKPFDPEAFLKVLDRISGAETAAAA